MSAGVRIPIRMKRIAFATAAVLCLAMAAVMGGLWYLGTTPAQRAIQEWVNRTIPGAVAWEVSNISLLRGRIALANLRLSGPAGETLFEADGLGLTIRWRDAASGRLTVTEASLDHPRIRAAVDSEGRFNWSRAFPAGNAEPSPSQGPPVRIRIGSLIVSDGEILYEKAASTPEGSPERAEVRGLGLRLSDADLGDGSPASMTAKLDAGIRGIEVDVPGLATTAGPITLGSGITKGSLQGIYFTAGGEDWDVSLSGNIRDILNAPSADLTVSGSLLLEALERMTGAPVPAGGRLRFRVTAAGALPSPEIGLSVTIAEGRILNTDLHSASADLRLKDRILSLSSASASSSWGTLHATGRADLSPLLKNGRLSPVPAREEALIYGLALKLEDVRLAGLPVADNPMSGEIRSEIDIAGKGISPHTMTVEATVTADARRIAVSEKLLPTDALINARLSYESGKVRADELVIKTRGTTLTAAAAYDPGTGDLSGALSAISPDLSALLSAMGVSDVSGSAEVAAEVSGSPARPAASIRVRGRELEAAGVRLGNLAVEGVLKPDGVLDIGSISLENRSSRITGGGSLRLFGEGFGPAKEKTAALSVDLNAVEAAHFLKAGKQVSGIYNGRLTMEGPITAPAVTLALTGKGIAVEGRRIGDLTAAFGLADGTLRITPLAVKNGRSDLTVSGTARIIDPKTRTLLADPIVDLRLNGEKLFLEDVADGWSGAMSISGRITGRLSDPEGEAAISAGGLVAAGRELAGLNVKTDFSGGRVRLAACEATAPGGQKITAGGWIDPFQKTYDLTLRSAGIDLRRIQKDSPADGRIRFDLAGRGRFESPRIGGTIAADPVKIRGYELDPITLAVSMDGPRIQVSGRFIGDLAAEADMTTRRFSANLGLTRAGLGPYFAWAGLTAYDGSLTGAVKASGMWDAPDGVTVAADVSALRVRMDQKEILRSDGFGISLENGLLTIPGIRLTLLNRGEFTLQGKGRLTGDWDIGVQGLLPLEVFRNASEALQSLSGEVELAGRFTGSPAAPDLRADIRLKEISLTVPGLEQALSDVSGHITVTPRSVVCEKISGRLDTGTLTLTGAVDLENFRPRKTSLRLTAEQVPFRIPDTADITLEGILDLAGTPDKALLAGKITLIEGLFYKDVELDLLELARRKSRETAPVSPGSRPFLKALTLDVDVTYRNPLIFENNMAVMALKPTLKVHGAADHLLITGRAAVDPGGSIRYQENEFEITKGVIDFLNPYRIEPTLDIDGSTAIRTWTIYIAISGTPDNLKVDLRSEPPENQGDILSLLAVGKPTRELGGGGSVSVAQILADSLAKRLEERLKDATGLDVVELGYKEGEKGGGGPGDVSVTVGKELSRRIMVKYGVETRNGSTVQRATTEYKILEHLIMSAFQDTEGVFGGGIAYRLEFR